MEENIKKDKRFPIRMIAANALIAGLYVVITIACGPLSYSYMQIRFSELLNFLVFFNPYYTIGLTIGCLIANLFSTVGPIDIFMGAGATLIACLLIILYSKFIKNLFFSGLFPCLVNAIIVPFIIYLSSMGTSNEIILTPAVFFTMFGWVFLGEFVSIYLIGYPIFLSFSLKSKKFPKMILSTRPIDFKW